MAGRHLEFLPFMKLILVLNPTKENHGMTIRCFYLIDNGTFCEHERAYSIDISQSIGQL